MADGVGQLRSWLEAVMTAVRPARWWRVGVALAATVVLTESVRVAAWAGPATKPALTKPALTKPALTKPALTKPAAALPGDGLPFASAVFRATHNSYSGNVDGSKGSIVSQL